MAGWMKGEEVKDDRKGERTNRSPEIKVEEREKGLGERRGRMEGLWDGWRSLQEGWMNRKTVLLKERKTI